MHEFLPKTDVICSGYAAEPNYDNMFAGSNFDAEDFDDYNVLRGDMNLIGPRPALYNQEDLMAERDKYGANFIRPGITGLAQVMGRDELPIDVKARYDGIYTQNIGPVTDIYCMFRTIGVVLKSEGVVEGGTGTLEEAEKECKQ